jgi:hypothetical protein
MGDVLVICAKHLKAELGGRLVSSRFGSSRSLSRQYCEFASLRFVSDHSLVPSSLIPVLPRPLTHPFFLPPAPSRSLS